MPTMDAIAGGLEPSAWSSIHLEKNVPVTEVQCRRGYRNAYLAFRLPIWPYAASPMHAAPKPTGSTSDRVASGTSCMVARHAIPPCGQPSYWPSIFPLPSDATYITSCLSFRSHELKKRRNPWIFLIADRFSNPATPTMRRARPIQFTHPCPCTCPHPETLWMIRPFALCEHITKYCPQQPVHSRFGTGALFPSHPNPSHSSTMKPLLSEGWSFILL